MTEHSGAQLSLAEAASTFRGMPARWQLASLHPQLVELDAMRDRLLRPVHWCFRAGERVLLHSFHLGANPGLGVTDIQSATGYGGPLSNSDDPAFLRDADTAARRWAAEHGVVAEFLRFHPMVPHARWYAGEVARNRDTVRIDLARDPAEQYQPRRRTDVRRFLKAGVRVERVPAEAMRQLFPPMYRDSMDQAGALARYYFGQDYFDALLGLERVEGWLAYEDARALAGAIVLVSPEAGVAEYHLGAKSAGAERHKATVGLLHVAAGAYRERGLRDFYLGGGRSVAEDDSLLYFKRGFSPQTDPYHIGSRVYDARHYERLKAQFPAATGSGRVLFYKD